MLHKLRAADAPRFGPPEEVLPRLEAGEVASSVHETPAGLIYVGGRLDARYGVWLEPPDGPRALVLPDTKSHHVTAAWPAGDKIIAQVARPGVGVSDVVVLLDPEGGPPEGLDGHVVRVSANGEIAVIVDLDAKRLVRLEIRTGLAADVAPLVFESQEQPLPLLSVDADGARALVMEVEAGRTRLMQVDLSSGAREPVVEGLPEPSWAYGDHVRGEGLVVQEMVLDETPRYRLLRLDAGKPAETLLELGHGQVPNRVVRLKPGWLALLLSLEPYPLTAYGPTEVVAVPTGGGARVELSKLGRVQGSLRTTNAGLVVEGRSRILRLPRR